MKCPSRAHCPYSLHNHHWPWNTAEFIVLWRYLLTLLWSVFYFPLCTWACLCSTASLLIFSDNDVWFPCHRTCLPYDRFGANFVYIRFDVFTAVTKKNAVICDLGSVWVLLEPKFRRNLSPPTLFLHLRFWPEDGGGKFLRHMGSNKIYTSSHTKRLHSSIYYML
jgi:hypothetical protein